MFEYLMIPVVLAILLLILALPLIVIYLFVRITHEAFEMVGFGHWHATLMVFGSIIGGMVDIPLNFRPITGYPSFYLDIMSMLPVNIDLSFNPVVIAVNLGGCIIPVLVSLDLLRRGRAALKLALIGASVVAIITYQAAMAVPGVGIMLPVYLPPILAAFCGLVLAKGYYTAPALAYISGSMGTLLGADIFSLLTPGVLPALSPPMGQRTMILSIGGAGVFDGIFLTGVLAVFLAAVTVCIFRRSGCGK